MNTSVARVVARNCWHMASKFQELSPAAQKVFAAMGGVNYKMPVGRFALWCKSVSVKILK